MDKDEDQQSITSSLSFASNCSLDVNVEPLETKDLLDRLKTKSPSIRALAEEALLENGHEKMTLLLSRDPEAAQAIIAINGGEIPMGYNATPRKTIHTLEKKASLRERRFTVGIIAGVLFLPVVAIVATAIQVLTHVLTTNNYNNQSATFAP